MKSVTAVCCFRSSRGILSLIYVLKKKKSAEAWTWASERNEASELVMERGRERENKLFIETIIIQHHHPFEWAK